MEEEEEEDDEDEDEDEDGDRKERCRGEEEEAVEEERSNARHLRPRGPLERRGQSSTVHPKHKHFKEPPQLVCFIPHLHQSMHV